MAWEAGGGWVDVRVCPPRVEEGDKEGAGGVHDGGEGEGDKQEPAHGNKGSRRSGERGGEAGSQLVEDRGAAHYQIRAQTGGIGGGGGWAGTCGIAECPA